MKKLLSIVVPIYNEEANIAAFYEALDSSLSSLEHIFDFEILMIDDGSRDNSWKKIVSIADYDKRIKAFKFSRNFGHQMALSAGYDFSIGDAVISLDADLQHPPELIAPMITAWQDGAKIVYVKNKDRHATIFKNYTAKIFYKILDKISCFNMPSDIQDFRLIDKCIVEILRYSREKSRYLRGLVAWTGFKNVTIYGSYSKRYAGQSGYSLSKMLKLAADGIFNFSFFPLKISYFLGLIIIFFYCFINLKLFYDLLILNINHSVLVWLFTLFFLFVGLLFIVLWFIGEYIARIYEELKNRPLYIIEQKKNIDVNDKFKTYEYPMARPYSCSCRI